MPEATYIYHNKSILTASTEVSKNIPNHEKPFRSTYSNSDSGPYLVHVELVNSSPQNSVTLHPLKFGHFLCKNNLKDILENSIKRIGRNRLSIQFKTVNSANAFLSHTLLSQNNYKTYIPTFNICMMGIVRGLPIEWSHEDIINNLQVPDGIGAVIKTRRLSRKTVTPEGTQWIPTQTVVLTLDGQSLPSHVYCFFTSIPVEQYFFPTIQCFHCCRFGHTRTLCRSTPRCYKCGDEHDGTSCTTEEYSCINCKGSHMATHKNCPEFIRQTNIKKHMSNNSVSYQETSKLFPLAKKQYSEVVSSNPINLTNQSTPNEPFNKLLTNNKTSSYTKTVILKQKPHRGLQQGYDKVAHNNFYQTGNSQVQVIDVL